MMKSFKIGILATTVFFFTACDVKAVKEVLTYTFKDEKVKQCEGENMHLVCMEIKIDKTSSLDEDSNLTGIWDEMAIMVRMDNPLWQEDNVSVRIEKFNTWLKEG